jgi:hypothetical protein
MLVHIIQLMVAFLVCALGAQEGQKSAMSMVADVWGYNLLLRQTRIGNIS